MRIVFAASECVPFAKTGGLADVVGALAPELVKLGHEVKVYLPLYRSCGSKLLERSNLLSGRSRSLSRITAGLRESWMAAN